MIGIEIASGEFLDLLPDTRINFKLSNPIFSTGDIIPGEYSLPFTIPLTDKNSRMLQHLDVIENRSILGIFKSVKLRFDGLQVKKGDLVIREIDPDETAQANFRFGITTLADQFKSSSIRQLCNDTITLFDDSTYVKTFFLEIDQTGTVRLTVGDIEYSYDTGGLVSTSDYESLAALINQDTDSHNTLAERKFSGGPFTGGPHLTLQPATDPTSLSSPMDIKDFTNLKIDSNFDSHFNLFQNGTKAYLNEGNEPNDIIRFWMYHNTGVFTENGFSGQSDPVNLSFDQVSETTFVNSTWTASRNRQVTVPLVTVKYVFEKIATSLDINFTGDFLKTERYASDVVLNTLSIMEAVLFFQDRFALFHKNTITVANHLPDLKVNQWLKAFQSRYRLALNYEAKSNSLSMDFISNILAKAEYKDITHLTGEIQSIVNPEFSGVSIEANQGDEDRIGGTDIYSFGINPDKTIDSQIGSIVNKRFERALVNQEDKEPKTLKVLQKSTILGANKNDAAPQKLEDLSEDLNPYLRMLIRGKEIKTSVRYSAIEIFSLDWKEKQRIDQVNYLIKEADVTLSMQGIEPVSCIMVAV